MPVAIILLAFAFLLHFCLPTYFKLHCKAFLAPTQKASYFIRKMDTSEHSALLSFVIRKSKIYLIIKPPNICGFLSHFLCDAGTSVPCSTLILFSVIWIFLTFNPFHGIKIIFLNIAFLLPINSPKILQTAFQIFHSLMGQ